MFIRVHPWLNVLIPPFNESHSRNVSNGVVTAGDLILDDAISGRERTFDALVEAHRPQVVRTAYRILTNMEDAQDVAQDVFLRLFKNIDQIDGPPSAWLYRVTVNACQVSTAAGSRFWNWWSVPTLRPVRSARWHWKNARGS